MDDGWWRWLQLNLQNKCGESKQCKCGSARIVGITASKVTNDSNTVGFVVLVHESDKPFTLLQDLGNGEELEVNQEVKNVTKVSVYYWKGDDYFQNPLLLKVDIDCSNTRYYYRYSECELKSKGKNPKFWQYIGPSTSNLTLQVMLDDRNCGRNHAVPLNIKDPEAGTLPSDVNSTCLKTKRKISLVDLQLLTGDEYTIEEYKINGENTKISRATYGTDYIPGINLPHDYKVSKVRMFSYSRSQVPLMLQFVKNGGTEESKWFYSASKDGNNWESVDEEKSEAFYDTGHQPQEALTTTLDDIRCLRDSEITLNLTKDAYTGGKPCCEHHKDEKKVSVKEVPVNHNHQHVPSNNLTVKKHSISSGYSVSAIKYNEGGSGQVKSITLNGLQFPISSHVSVYVLYCGNNPALIYVKGNGQAKWYQKPTGSSSSGNGNEQWEKVELDGITPSSFHNLGCQQWNDFVNVLTDYGYKNLQRCPGTRVIKIVVGGVSGSIIALLGGFETLAFFKYPSKSVIRSIVGMFNKSLDYTPVEQLDGLIFIGTQNSGISAAHLYQNFLRNVV
ncbi:hypothetical protein BEWA_048170 [Theileria equi strain WA]|uniref:Uncharacterized protein n=1 Tax=Theileria equi strain WA TaxID=1537102 RepID=L1LAP5_THEEQ|nr:hypothetical protein BEWA_048170 [Theileria equi strain WA]EKX72350.1 hypothetical protein BEWA_048170 [Theileria equi strain WA]|eukprot:XP_004831802.1 hypothetical protein BEWA_048170 [Theileria equi strain WA]